MRKISNIHSFDTRLSRGVRGNNFAYRTYLKPLAVIIVISFISLTCGFAVSAYADGVSEELETQIADLINRLDLSDLQSYIDDCGTEYFFGYGDTAEEIISYLISGDLSSDYGSYLSELFAVLFDDALSLVPAFIQIAVIAILSAIVSNAEGGIISGATSKIVRLVCTALIVLLLASMLYGIADCCIECIQTIRKQVEIITPLLITLTVLTGGTSSAAVFQPIATFLAGGVIELICGFIIPSAIISSILNFTSHFNADISFTGVSKFIKSIIKWTIGITAAVFSIFLTVQGSSASLFDGIFFKATKYVVGSSVPIVGGFIAGGLDTLTSAGLLIKSSVGLCGIILLVSEVIEPILLLAAFSLMLKLMSAVVQPLGENGLSSLFSEIAGDVEHMSAAVITVAFMYALVVMMMINSAGSFI